MLTLEQKMRAAHVRRWHIVATVREQTIAEHMYRVALITEELLRALGLLDWGNSITLNAMEWARVHDLHEVVMGDMPSNAKRMLGPAGADILDKTAHAVDQAVSDLAYCVSPEGECPLAGYIVKVADLAEACNWIRDFGAGAHARQVHDGLRQHLSRAIGELFRAHDLHLAVAIDMETQINIYTITGKLTGPV